MTNVWEGLKKSGRSLVEIHYKDGRAPDLLDGIHQILMMSQDHLAMTHGSRTETLPYGIIDCIIVRFKDDSSN